MIQELYFNSLKQLQIFFLLINNMNNKVKGLDKTTISNRLNIPITTVYDNLIKLKYRNYVNNYGFNNGKKGRNKIIWFIPKNLYQQFLSFNLPEISINGIIINE